LPSEFCSSPWPPPRMPRLPRPVLRLLPRVQPFSQWHRSLPLRAPARRLRTRPASRQASSSLRQLLRREGCAVPDAEPRAGTSAGRWGGPVSRTASPRSASASAIASLRALLVIRPAVSPAIGGPRVDLWSRARGPGRAPQEEEIGSSEWRRPRKKLVTQPVRSTCNSSPDRIRIVRRCLLVNL
jgi:hypothetical protein